MTANKPFVIATNVPDFDDPLLNNVNNLVYRLKIQQDNISKTETEIQDLLETILINKGIPHEFTDEVMELLSWTVSDSRCRQAEIYREICLYLANTEKDELNPASVATDIRKILR